MLQLFTAPARKGKKRTIIEEGMGRGKGEGGGLNRQLEFWTCLLWVATWEIGVGGV